MIRKTGKDKKKKRRKSERDLSGEKQVVVKDERKHGHRKRV